MATTFSAKLNFLLTATYSVTDDDLTTPKSVLTKEILDSLSNGTGSGKAHCIWSDTITASDGGATIDVYGGITDVFGNTLSMDQIKGLLIHNKSTTTGEYIDVGGAAAQGIEMFGNTSDIIRVHPEGVLFYWAPGAVADCPSPGAGAADEILITAASGKTPEVDIIIIGENA